MDKPVLNVRASLHKYKMTLLRFGVRGCAINLVALSISLVEENASMWIMPQHLCVLSC